ncbi:Maf family nucleotide pyrophosphatase [Aestuariibacter sp. AA17]|uniref:7-methyl-GTP pyrophosphatase n=1 Tax=Fluctibacter corallii TaxID=2984329 RepID=A0ABT3A6T4_9ALTE|nr:nucleoside triphosphate pyrophosphatase [Aestuariibacter sp. AA17]MCV2884282.1 Maf family nucleotide pyrophosphatase [Aestuariibacter sp. AA17]
MHSFVLASTSPYRKQLLQRLIPDFITAPPIADETPLKHEQPHALAYRLAELKATSLQTTYPNHIIIGSDQVASFDGKPIGKPGNRQSAIEQLLACQGKTVSFYTGLTLLNTASGQMLTSVDTFNVSFRSLTLQQIEHYVDKEQPFDCAGSFKSEGLGIALFSELSGRDPNALIGLPLIALTDALITLGLHPLSDD